MASPKDEYNNVLLDKIMELRSRHNYMDGAMRYFAESEINPGMEELLLKKAEVLTLMEIARLMSISHQRPS